jgi:hypothetical protein
MIAHFMIAQVTSSCSPVANTCSTGVATERVTTSFASVLQNHMAAANTLLTAAGLFKTSTATELATSSSQSDAAAPTDDVSLLPLTGLPMSPSALDESFAAPTDDVSLLPLTGLPMSPSASHAPRHMPHAPRTSTNAPKHDHSIVVFVNIGWKASRHATVASAKKNITRLKTTVRSIIETHEPAVICFCEVGESSNPLTPDQMSTVSQAIKDTWHELLQSTQLQCSFKQGFPYLTVWDSSRVHWNPLQHDSTNSSSSSSSSRIAVGTDSAVLL